MEDIVKMIAELGILLIIAGVFIFNSVAHNKLIDALLKDLLVLAKMQGKEIEDIKASCKMSAADISITQHALSSFAQAYDRHDQRSEAMYADLKEVKVALVGRPCVIPTVNND